MHRKEGHLLGWVFRYSGSVATPAWPARARSVRTCSWRRAGDSGISWRGPALPSPRVRSHLARLPVWAGSGSLSESSPPATMQQRRRDWAALGWPALSADSASNVDNLHN
jgi:hypothetical protein